VSGGHSGALKHLSGIYCSSFGPGAVLEVQAVEMSKVGRVSLFPHFRYGNSGFSNAISERRF
jgi:hypothetical protein